MLFSDVGYFVVRAALWCNKRNNTPFSRRLFMAITRKCDVIHKTGST